MSSLCLEIQRATLNRHQLTIHLYDSRQIRVVSRASNTLENDFLKASLFTTQLHETVSCDVLLRSLEMRQRHLYKGGHRLSGFAGI